MCRQSLHHDQENTSVAMRKAKFYKHLTVYLAVVGFATFGQFFATGHLHTPLFAFWWGIGVVAHYLSVFGWQHPAETDTPRNFMHSDEPEPRTNNRERIRTWRDRDLV